TSLGFVSKYLGARKFLIPLFEASPVPIVSNGRRFQELDGNLWRRPAHIRTQDWSRSGRSDCRAHRYCLPHKIPDNGSCLRPKMERGRGGTRIDARRAGGYQLYDVASALVRQFASVGCASDKDDAPGLLDG